MTSTRKSLFACTPATSRGQAVQLSADPKNEKLLYANGRSVYIRDLANPALCSEYTEHTCAATVARWAPSGYYIASGDVQGNVRIWDATQESQILKLQTRPISGRINDLQWDSESKRLIAVGDGKERFGHAFSFDTGNSVGEILGHSKVVNSCTIRNNRPFRAATCSDDMTVNFYHGAPYKFNRSLADHTRFVQCVRFSPDGQFLVSVGSDAKIFLYDGSSGDKIGEFAENGHSGGIFSLSWSPDSKQFLTSSADMTVKIWDVETKKAVNTIQFSGTVDDQQVGNLWADSYLLSLSLSGDINYLDARAPKPAKVVHGHQKAITAFTIHPQSKTLYTGSYDGHVYSWSTDSGIAAEVDGNGHKNQVSAFSHTASKIYSVGMDDTLRVVDLEKRAFDNVAVPTNAVPTAVASHSNISVVTTLKEILVVKDGKVTCAIKADAPQAVALSPDEKEIAVGGEDQKVTLFQLSGDTLTKKTQLEANRGVITCLAYSPDGNYLAAGDSDRKVVVYDTKTHQVAISQWVFHTARVNCLAWSASSKYAVSGGLDRNIFVWSVDKPMKSIAIKNAHQEGVTGVEFLDEGTVVSTGQDACVKTWTLQHHL